MRWGPLDCELWICKDPWVSQPSLRVSQEEAFSTRLHRKMHGCP